MFSSVRWGQLSLLCFPLGLGKAWRVKLGPPKDTVWPRERPLGVGDSGQALGEGSVKTDFPMAWDVVHW